MPRKVRTLSDLLDEVLALPPPQRMGWVEAQHDAPPELRPRQRALVERSCAPEHAALLGTLPKLADDARSEAVAHFAGHPHAAGERIGAYRLVRPLGAGAMGSVWLAAHETTHAPVAIKLAHMAPKRSDLLARLEREQQLLARLDHPNIAKLLAAGMTRAGQPYLLLEYVAGQRLDAYCQQRPLSLPRRLQLFLQIALAVAHAHEQRIVHRDLKPANVMVNADGAVRLLDFGIGKLLGEGIAAALALSAVAGQPLTPSYASPEQLTGSAVEEPSDIYSLGVVLYELLTGARPHEARNGTGLALRHAVLDELPAPPSERMSSTGAALTPPLRAELDALVLTALAKRPERRHASARAFAQAIHGLLEAGS